MSTTNASDGQASGQDTQQGAEGDDQGGGRKPVQKDRLEDLEARVDMINDGIAEIRNALRPRPQPQEEVEINDDEPLTGSKVKKIVERSINQAVAGTNAQNERAVWDQKAKDEFPLQDPKFRREFQKLFKEQVESGLDPKHPKAIYNVARLTSKELGTPAPKREERETVRDERETSEAPSGGGSSRVQPRNGARSNVRDDDPRVSFYTMKGGKTKEQIEAFKQKLGQKDQRSQRRER